MNQQPPNKKTALYRVETPSLTMADVRAHLKARRESPREPKDNLGIAYVKAFGGLGKAAKPLSRRQRFEAREAKRLTRREAA